MPGVRSVMVAAWVGSTNVGDELVFRSLARKLRAREIDVLATSVNAHATVRDHNVRAVRHLDPRAVRRVDAVIFGGGGVLQDETSAFNLPHHLSRPLSGRLTQRPVAGIGLGAGPLTHRSSRWLVRGGLRNVYPITVRDDESRSLLQSVGIESRTTADLVFGLDPPEGVEPDRLVACLRPWSGRRHVLPARHRPAETPDWFVTGAAVALDDASKALGLPVHFVALQPDRDHPLHEEVASRMQASVTFATPAVHDAVEEIGRGGVVVSMRYHGVVCATLGGRPSVAIGYSPKVDSLAADLGRASQLVSWSPEGVASIADAVHNVAAHHADAVEGRERLRARERGNDDAIDELLARISH